MFFKLLKLWIPRCRFDPIDIPLDTSQVLSKIIYLIIISLAELHAVIMELLHLLVAVLQSLSDDVGQVSSTVALGVEDLLNAAFHRVRVGFHRILIDLGGSVHGATRVGIAVAHWNRDDTTHRGLEISMN